MTNAEKRAALAASLAPDTDTDEVLDNVLADAEALILNRMYPFGYPDDTVVPARYERIQIQLATELYSLGCTLYPLELFTSIPQRHCRFG